MGRNSSALKFGWIAGASKLTPVQGRGGALRADYAVLVKKGARVPAKPHIRAASSHQRPLLPPPWWPPHLTTPILTNHPYLPAICPSHNWKSRARASMQSNRFCKIWGDKYTPQIASRLLRPFIPFVERLIYGDIKIDIDINCPCDFLSILWVIFTWEMQRIWVYVRNATLAT